VSVCPLAYFEIHSYKLHKMFGSVRVILVLPPPETTLQLCTSGLLDVMFSHNKQYVDVLDGLREITEHILHSFTFPRFIGQRWQSIYINLYSPTERNDGSTQKHSSVSINTNKAKTATKSITVVDTWNCIIIILHQT